VLPDAERLSQDTSETNLSGIRSWAPSPPKVITANWIWARALSSSARLSIIVRIAWFKTSILPFEAMLPLTSARTITGKGLEVGTRISLVVVIVFLEGSVVIAVKTIQADAPDAPAAHLGVPIGGNNRIVGAANHLDAQILTEIQSFLKVLFDFFATNSVDTRSASPLKLSIHGHHVHSIVREIPFAQSGNGVVRQWHIKEVTNAGVRIYKHLTAPITCGGQFRRHLPFFNAQIVPM
jgi:hypothetical protein